MNDRIINEIKKELNISAKSIEEALKLLSEGNTIPFIARYRKERTNGLDETEIRKISEYYEYQTNLENRKEEVIRLIEEKDLMTEELKQHILSAEKLVDVEDLYRPFKEKKKTKASEAIKNGLEGLSKSIMSFNENDIDTIASKYLNEEVKSIEDAITGAKYIIAEWISDNASYRKYIRNITYKVGFLTSKKKKSSEDELKTYEMYYDYSEALKYIKLYRVLAINRGEKEKVLNVSISIDDAVIIEYLKSKLIKDNKNTIIVNIVNDAIIDSYKRLISPSIEREVRTELKKEAELVAIENFSANLEKLLMQPPLKEKVILGFDPAYRTGCKLAVLDSCGMPLKISVIYPHAPQNKYEEAKQNVLNLINEYNIDVIAIGNGTASRESEAFIADILKESKHNTQYIIVNEAGASVYSASKLAIEEFPTLQVEQRSAISIGRRLLDPLSELVKIDPESIGVGLYQHDVTEKNLKESLKFVVEKVVNSIGVNINTASVSILKYVSGLNKSSIEKLINYRTKNIKINSREELLKNKILTPKVYEQSIGFLRIIDGSNFLDQTSIHPESYSHTMKLLDYIKTNKQTEIIKKLDNLSESELLDVLEIDNYTLSDIIESLKKPNRDPRDMLPKPILKSDLLKLEDLKVGMKVQGTVRNVIDFGAFIDIGIKNDGLLHISKITNRFLKHPSEVLQVTDIVDVYIDDVNLEKQKVSLTMLKKDEI